MSIIIIATIISIIVLSKVFLSKVFLSKSTPLTIHNCKYCGYKVNRPCSKKESKKCGNTLTDWENLPF